MIVLLIVISNSIGMTGRTLVVAIEQHHRPSLLKSD